MRGRIIKKRSVYEWIRLEEVRVNYLDREVQEWEEREEVSKG